MGLVGGMGSGLHALLQYVDGRVPCWLSGCVAASHYSAVRGKNGDGVQEKSWRFQEAVSETGACPIRTLQERYQSTPPTAAIFVAVD